MCQERHHPDAGLYCSISGSVRARFLQQWFLRSSRNNTRECDVPTRAGGKCTSHGCCTSNYSTFEHIFREQILYGNEPLLGDHGFDSCAAAVACADVVAVGLDFNQCAALPEIFNKYFAAFFGCKSGIFSAEFVDMPVLREHTHAGEPRALTDFKIVRIMTRSDFNGTGAEVHFNIFIRNYGNFPADDGHNNGFADNFRIARVIGVNGYACVAEDGFRAGRCADDGLLGCSTKSTSALEIAVLQCGHQLTMRSPR